MEQEVQLLIDQYYAWLKDKTRLRQLKDWVEITTPYLDRHNDYIQIYAKQAKNGYLLSDDGYTIEDLEQSGCKLQSPKRQELLNMTLNGFGVQHSNGVLEVDTTANSFALRKHNLVQAILAVNDIFYLAAPTIAKLFHEDVASWLDNEDIRYTPGVKFTGKSNFDHLFNFVIPKSSQQPERILQVMNRPDRNTAQAMAFAWHDTQKVRSSNSKAYAVLNDTEQPVLSSVLDALNNYGVTSVHWSRREEIQEELAA